MAGEKVVVGMSGGVDSSVAAYLLKQQGFDVIGVTMQIWQDESLEQIQENGGCCGLSAVEDAKRVASKLEIPHYVMNFKKEFKSRVIDYFIREYESARTPNPCIACNRYIKWESLLRRSLDIGAKYIATGHYARVVHLPDGRYALKKSATEAKDQTYALYNLTQDQLAHTLMPCGDYTKDQIRDIAREIGLSVASKPDSQEICFVPDGDYGKFIENETHKASIPGNFVNEKGEILGRHKGLIHYTIGQRRGLGIPAGRRIFVTKLDSKTNEVVLGEAENIFGDKLKANQINWMGVQKPEMGDMLKFTAKIRYNHKGTPCQIECVGEDELICHFTEPVRAITPGQAVVFYQGDILAGGGNIISAL